MSLIRITHLFGGHTNNTSPPSLQVYFQRVLSSKSAAKAEILSYIAAVGCILMALPPVLIGGIAKVTSLSDQRAVPLLLKHGSRGVATF